MVWDIFLGVRSLAFDHRGIECAEVRVNRLGADVRVNYQPGWA